MRPTQELYVSAIAKELRDTETQIQQMETMLALMKHRVGSIANLVLQLTTGQGVEIDDPEIPVLTEVITTVPPKPPEVTVAELPTKIACSSLNNPNNPSVRQWAVSLDNDLLRDSLHSLLQKYLSPTVVPSDSGFLGMGFIRPTNRTRDVETFIRTDGEDYRSVQMLDGATMVINCETNQHGEIVDYKPTVTWRDLPSGFYNRYYQSDQPGYPENRIGEVTFSLKTVNFDLLFWCHDPGPHNPQTCVVYYPQPDENVSDGLLGREMKSMLEEFEEELKRLTDIAIYNETNQL